MKAGPPPKPNHRRQRRNKRPQLVLAAPSDSEDGPPPCPPQLLPEVTERWFKFWEESPLVGVMQMTDLPALRRLFVFYDEWERSYREMRADPGPPPTQGEDETWNEFQVRLGSWSRKVATAGRLVSSPRGGLYINPLIRYMELLHKQIIALEDRFGFNLEQRQRLGLNDLRAKTLADINSSVIQEVRNEQQPSSVEDEDPLAALLEPTPDPGRPPTS